MRLPKVLWEPAVGNGAIVRPLRAAGYSVIASDIADYGLEECAHGVDYLTANSTVPIGGLVTNPPYKLACKGPSDAPTSPCCCGSTSWRARPGEVARLEDAGGGMSEPPFLRRLADRRFGLVGRQAEERTAKRLGAKLTPASGALDGAKGDMALGCFLIENKSTVQGRIGLKFDWLAKIAREARTLGKRPALALSFTTGDGRPIVDGKWVLIPEHVFDELVKDDQR